MRIKEKLGVHSAAELRQKAREWLARSAVNRIREEPNLNKQTECGFVLFRKFPEVNGSVLPIGKYKAMSCITIRYCLTAQTRTPSSIKSRTKKGEQDVTAAIIEN